jgi:hypothetical protein
LGGYISVDFGEDNECDNDEDNNDEENMNIIDFRYEMIYNCMCILQNQEEILIKRLKEVKKYIDEIKNTFKM